MTSNKKVLTVVQRSNILLLHEEGLSQVQIAKRVLCSRNGVQSTLKRFAETGSVENRPIPGRPRKISVRSVRKLVRASLSNRKLSSLELAQGYNAEKKENISPSTVRRRLAEAGLRGCKARKKPYLSEKNRKARLEWAKNHRHWTVEDWANVLWSDETNIEVRTIVILNKHNKKLKIKISLKEVFKKNKPKNLRNSLFFKQVFSTPGVVYVRRRPGEEYRPDCIVPTVKFGGGSVMIWGCMAPSGVGEIFICEGRMNSTTYTAMLSEVLEPSLLKLFSEEQEESILFQQDNAPCHTSALSTAFFRENGIRVLEWPAQSPDLNPIEQLWGTLKKKVALHKSRSKTELKKRIIDEWSKIPPAECNTLIQSMPRRVAAVIRAKGGATRY